MEHPQEGLPSYRREQVVAILPLGGAVVLVYDDEPAPLAKIEAPSVYIPEPRLDPQQPPSQEELEKSMTEIAEAAKKQFAEQTPQTSEKPYLQPPKVPRAKLKSA